MGFPGGSVAEESACNLGDWVGKIPWRRKWQPTPVFLPGKSRAQRSLVGYSPRGRKESDTTEQLRKKKKSSMVEYWKIVLEVFGNDFDVS